MLVGDILHQGQNSRQGLNPSLDWNQQWTEALEKAAPLFVKRTHMTDRLSRRFSFGQSPRVGRVHDRLTNMSIPGWFPLHSPLQIEPECFCFPHSSDDCEYRCCYVLYRAERAMYSVPTVQQHLTSACARPETLDVRAADDKRCCALVERKGIMIRVLLSSASPNDESSMLKCNHNHHASGQPTSV